MAINASYVILSWDEVPCGYRAGIITEYIYEARDNLDMLVSSGRINETTTHIHGLQECITYTFLVAGVNSQGTGPFVRLQASTIAASGKYQ